jgi:hypothetical protein
LSFLQRHCFLGYIENIKQVNPDYLSCKYFAGLDLGKQVRDSSRNCERRSKAPSASLQDNIGEGKGAWL